ncbi:MAG: arylsulfatase [Planctomycetes bacterium]|nr:arylsulfatase [Planctomycetota bacterium]
MIQRILPLLVALLAIAGSRALGAPSDAPPCIVLIMSDDMGFSDIGCYGGEIRTPNLDRLAAGGLRFTQFYNTARCCPTRASLLSGLYPHQAGVGWMLADQKLEGYSTGLNERCVTIAEVLRAAGYRTYMTGKWHVTAHTTPGGPKDNWPLQRGFERFYGTITGGGNYYDPTTLCRQNTYITPVNDPEYRPERFYYTDAISDNAVRYIDGHARETPEKPFFLYVAYTAAHWPMHALPEDIAAYKGTYDGGYRPIREARFRRLREMGLVGEACGLSPQAGDWEAFQHKAWEIRCMEVYAAMVTAMDRGIGRIVAALERHGRLEDTLIFFLQDNGGCAETMGRGPKVNDKWIAGVKDSRPMGPDELQPSIWPPMKTRDGRPVRGGPGVMPGPADTYIGYGRNWANVSNAPFREYKHWVHEGGISTPLIVHWPARIRARGELRRQPGHLIDIMATCVDVAGAAYPKERGGKPVTPMEGKSLVPALANERIERDAIYWEHEANCAIRAGKWKLVRKGNMNTGKLGPWELYDMETDRSELHDLSKEDPRRVEEMARKWEAWAERAHAKPWPWGRKP